MKVPSIRFKGKLTETKAIKLSLDLWTYLSVTGKGKPKKFRDRFKCGCPLCEYDDLTYDGKENNYCEFDCPLRGDDVCHIFFINWLDNLYENTKRTKFYANKIKNILQKSYNKIKNG